MFSKKSLVSSSLIKGPISFGLSGHPPRLYPIRGLGLFARRPEALLIRGMPTGPWVFLAMSGACGLLPCDQTHLKKALYHIRLVVGRMINTTVSCIKLNKAFLSLFASGYSFQSPNWCYVCLLWVIFIVYQLD